MVPMTRAAESKLVMKYKSVMTKAMICRTILISSYFSITIKNLLSSSIQPRRCNQSGAPKTSRAVLVTEKKKWLKSEKKITKIDPHSNVQEKNHQSCIFYDTRKQIANSHVTSLFEKFYEALALFCISVRMCIHRCLAIESN